MIEMTIKNMITNKVFDKTFEDLRKAKCYYWRVKKSNYLYMMSFRTETLTQYCFITGNM